MATTKMALQKQLEKLQKQLRDNLLAEKRLVIAEIGKQRFTQVVAIIYGEKMFLNEIDVRAIQVIARYKAEQGPEVFEDFCENVKIFSGPSIETSHQMEFRPDGRFSNSFNPGFYDVSSALLFAII